MYFKYAIIFIAGAQLCAALPAPSLCECNRQYSPVCGTDGVTYGNQCLLQCAQTSSNRPISTAYEAPCLRKPSTGDCGCSLEYIPVCGTDRKTYPNTCHASCSIASNPSLRIDYEGECKENNCVCIALYQPVCGSDGVTYSNECQLNCRTAQDPTLRVAYMSACGGNNVNIRPRSE